MKNIDRYAAVSGYILIFASIIVLKVRDFHPIYMVAAVIGLLAITVYLLCRDRLFVDEKLDIVVKALWSLLKDRLTAIHKSNGYGWFGIFVALSYLIIALVIFLMCPDQYEKPLPYYIFVAVAVGILFYLSVYESKRVRIYAILVLACVIGLMHIWTETLMFSGLIGIDPWSHMRMVTQELKDVKDWTYLGGYYSAVHFYLKWAMDLGLDYRMAALIFLGSVQMVGNIVFSFLLGKELFNIKVGVVAALMLSCANWNITFGEWIIPNSIGATFALATAYLMIKQYKHHWTIFIIGAILAVSYFSHMIIMVWVTGTIICFTVFPIIFTPDKSIKQVLIMLAKLSVVPVILIGLVIAWLMFTTNGPGLYDTAVSTNFNPAFGMTYAIGKAPLYEGQPVAVVVQDSLKIFDEMFVNSIGFLSFIGIALIGVLMMLRRSRFNITFSILCVTVLAIGFFPPLFGFSLVEMRWWYLAQCLMAVPLGAALVYLTQGKRYAVLIMSVLVMAVVFFNIIGLMSNNTQRALSPNQIVRYGLTDKEMAGLIVATSYNPNKIGSDTYYLSYVVSDIKRLSRAEWIEDHIFKGDFRDCEADVLLIRDSLYREPFGYGGGTIYRLNFNPADIAAKQGYRLVYSNGDIQCLIRR
jgi:hypothetical protein